jgi:hypothetical protein
MSSDRTTDDAPTLGRELIRALKNSTGSGRRSIEVEHDGSAAQAEVHGSGPYGSSIDRLTVVAPDRDLSTDEAGAEVRRQAAAVGERITYLPERLRAHEVEPGLGRAILRSEPGEIRGREYHEVELKGGREAEVGRHRFHDSEPGRERIPQGYSHEILERLTDDLDRALRPED